MYIGGERLETPGGRDVWGGGWAGWQDGTRIAKPGFQAGKGHLQTLQSLRTNGLMDARTAFTREAGAGILLAEGLGRGSDGQPQVLEQGGRQGKWDFCFSYLCFCSVFPKVDWSQLYVDSSGKAEMGGGD